MPKLREKEGREGSKVLLRKCRVANTGQLAFSITGQTKPPPLRSAHLGPNKLGVLLATARVRVASDVKSVT